MKISVLVPTLGKREKEIRRLLETLEKQSYKDFEIIFVTQDNHEIVKDIICKYGNLDIKQIEMSVKGLSRARNRGLEQASGEIVVLSDDDCWYPTNAFEIIVNAFEKRQSAIIVLSQIFDPEKNISYKNYTSNEEYVRNKMLFHYLFLSLPLLIFFSLLLSPPRCISESFSLRKVRGLRTDTHNRTFLISAE